MTRLTNDLRTTIADRAITGGFKARTDALTKAEQHLGMELYRHVFDEKTLKAVAKVPTHWLRQDQCLRFNCNGYDLRFNVEPAVPVPYSVSCGRLGNMTGDLAEKAQAHAEANQNLMRERRDALQAVMTMLNSVTTIAQLEKAWPEGREYYAIYAEARHGSNLPAVKVAEINKMLGLKEAA